MPESPADIDIRYLNVLRNVMQCIIQKELRHPFIMMTVD
jgi:hypothetical protein